METIDQNILTLTMGLGGWFGVLFAVAAQMINDDELNLGTVARYAVFPFVSSVGAVILIESTRGSLMIISSITNAMLNRIIILIFLESLVPLTCIAGLMWSAFLCGKAQRMVLEQQADDDEEEDDEDDTADDTADEDDEDDTADESSETHSSDMDTSSDTSEPKRRILNKSESWTCKDCGFVGSLDQDRVMCDCHEDDDSDVYTESNTCKWW